MKKILLAMYVCLIPFISHGEREGLAGKKYIEINAKDWINSQPLKLSSLKGKVVVLDFWATWCKPCTEAIPHLVEYSRKYESRGVQFIVIAINYKEEVDEFIKTNPSVGLTIPIACEGENDFNSKNYSITGIPRVVIIDRGGTIVWEGHPMSSSLEDKIIEAAGIGREEIPRTMMPRGYRPSLGTSEIMKRPKKK